MCLDYFHHGHVNILNKAGKYGNIILGLVTDKGIASYKKNKPTNSFILRKSIALMLKNVKHIIPVKDPNNYIFLSNKYKFEYVSDPTCLLSCINWARQVINIRY